MLVAVGAEVVEIYVGAGVVAVAGVIFRVAFAASSCALYGAVLVFAFVVGFSVEIADVAETGTAEVDVADEGFSEAHYAAEQRPRREP